VAAVWTLVKVIGPILKGIGDAIRADRQRKAQGGNSGLDIHEQDLPIGVVGLVIVLSIVPVALLLTGFAGTISKATLVAAIAYILVAGLVIASVTGYMAGLIGASNSPVSGVGILTVLGISVILLAMHGSGTGTEAKALVAFAIFVTGVIFGIATIANDNLQDLKTGQLVGATPWRQQVALVLGVVFGALVIPPVLDLLNQQLGFVGVPGAGPDALAAPQASLISSIAKGVLTGALDWNLMGLGALIGVGVILADELLKVSKKGALPPLAVGLGMYLPMEVTLFVVFGAVFGHLYNRWSARQSRPEVAERMGVLVATGLIVGDSLFSVAYSGLLALTGREDVLAIFPGFAWATPLGIAIFAALIWLAYARMRSAARAI
jgi:putative OPT family oligopeptide transporter